MDKIKTNTKLGVTTSIVSQINVINEFMETFRLNTQTDLKCTLSFKLGLAIFFIKFFKKTKTKKNSP